MELAELSNPDSVGRFIPEIVLVGAVVSLFVCGFLGGKRITGTGEGPGQKTQGKGTWHGRAVILAIGGSLMALYLVILRYLDLTGGVSAHSLFMGMIFIDPMTCFFEILFLTATILIVLFAVLSSEVHAGDKPEFLGLLLTTTLGAMLLSAAGDLLMIYLSLETVSITSYILAGFVGEKRRSSEAALKYVIYGAVASGVMIYGFSLIYGMSGTTDLRAIHKVIMENANQRSVFLLGMILSLAGFGYKIASVPFHMWCPDVYEGAPIAATAYFSVVPKAAGFAALIRFFYTCMVGPQPEGGIPGEEWSVLKGLDWPALVAVISAVTMTLGNLSAIPQKNLKRLLAYSSISHAGFILMGFVLLTGKGLESMLFYLAVYLIMNLGAFLVVLLALNKLGTEDIESLKGFGWRGGHAAFVGVTMVIFLFALTGIPGTAGFIGKLFILMAVIDKELYWLAIVGVLNSVVSLYYYAGIIKTIFLEEPETLKPVRFSTAGMALLAVLAIPTVFFGLYWQPLLDFSSHSLNIIGIP